MFFKPQNIKNYFKTFLKYYNNMETKTQDTTIDYSKMKLGRPKKYDGVEEALNANRMNNINNYYKKRTEILERKKKRYLEMKSLKLRENAKTG